MTFQIEYINSHSRDWKVYGPKMGKASVIELVKEMTGYNDGWRYRVVRDGTVVWPTPEEETGGSD